MLPSEFHDEPSEVFVPTVRAELGLTVRQLAAILGVSPATVWRWERQPEASGSREIPNLARKLLIWMTEPGRPADWPDFAHKR